MINDIVILGAGPAGLFTAFYAGMRGLNTVVVDQLEDVGGQLTALYPEKYIYDVAGFEKIKAGELIQNLKKQLKRFEYSTEYKLNTEILNIEKKITEEEKYFEVITNKGKIQAYSVIIAGGNGGFTPRKLGIENEDKLDIDYTLKTLDIYKNQDIIIFGGGDSAVDFALTVEPFANSTTIVHRREEFRAHEHSVDNLKNSKVNIYTSYNINSIEENNKKYEVKIINQENKNETLIVDKVICNFGFVSKLGNILNFGLNIEKNKIIVNSKQETNIPGIYAVGDICTYPGKANLIISGFGEAPTAINQAFLYINPEEKLKPIHSSNMFNKK